MDLANDRLSWSEGACRIFGLQPQEFGETGEAFIDGVHPDDRGAVEAAYSDSLRENREHVRRSSTGCWKDREIPDRPRSQHLRDAAGHLAAARCMTSRNASRPRRN